MSRNRNREASDAAAETEVVPAAPLIPPPGATNDNATNRFGPDKPVESPSPRARLCALLNLVDPSDAQLFSDAAARIEELERPKAKKD